jgi:hypothetical protein
MLWNTSKRDKNALFLKTYNTPTSVNAGGEDGSFYHSEHTVILEFVDAAAFVG